MQDDFDNLTDEQFAEMGKQHEAAQVEAAKQARDEQGRFVAAAPEAEQPVENTDEPDEIVYRREIDLGDGSGKQVFESDSYEGLIEELAKAQEHATRKIRELTAAKKTVEPPAETTISADDEWLVSQELMSTPSKGFQKLFEQQVGLKITDFKTKLARIEAWERSQSETQNAVEFVKATPDYVANDFNSSRMQQYLKTFNLEGTPENIQKAFTDLSQGGLLQLKSNETPGDTTSEPTQQRIAAPAGVRTTIIQKKAASGLSARGSAVTKGPPTTQDLYEMPMDEFLKVGGLSSQDTW